MAKKSTRKSVKKAEGPARKAPKPIALYYWPTPNGYKISIMLEELGVPYVVKPGEYRQGRAVRARLPQNLPQQPHAGHRRSRRAGRQADLGLRIRRHPAISGPQERPASIRQDERERVQVEEWLFWQVGGLGPMAGQANHFLNYAPEDLPIAKKRYTDEVHRLFGVMNKRLATRKFLAGRLFHRRHGLLELGAVGDRNIQPLDEFPHLKAWRDRVGGAAGGAGAARRWRRKCASPIDARRAQDALFGQRAR